MADSISVSVSFPVFGSFPNVLVVGSNDQPKKDISGKKENMIMKMTFQTLMKN
jgi:hypothetical protein